MRLKVSLHVKLGAWSKAFCFELGTSERGLVSSASDLTRLAINRDAFAEGLMNGLERNLRRRQFEGRI